MQGVDRTNGDSLPSAEFLGVCVSGDTDSHNIGKTRFESGCRIFVFALPYAFDLGSDTDDWPLVSISSGLSFASDFFSTYANGMAVVEAQGRVPNTWFENTRDFVAHLLRADRLCISATRGRQGRSNATDVY